MLYTYADPLYNAYNVVRMPMAEVCDVKILGMAATAARLGVHVGTLRNWTKEGKIAHIRDSAGRRLFLAEDVDEMVRKRAKEKGAKR